MSRGRQTLIGCGLGCLALTLLSIGSCVSFVYWLNRPGDVLEPERLLSTDATGYVEWTLRLEDPGTREFFELMLDELGQMNSEMPSFLPAGIDGPLRRLQQKNNEKKLRRMFPIVLVWTVEPRGAEEDDHVWSASLRGFDHQLLLADWILGKVIGKDDDAQIVHHGDEKIYLFDLEKDRGPLPVFIHSGDLFFTTDESHARRAVDRLRGPLVSEVGPALEPWLEASADSSLRGALSNRRGEVWRTWERFLDSEIHEKITPDLQSALRGVSIRGAFTPEGSLEAHVTFGFGEAGDADRAEASFTTAIADLIEDTPLELASTRTTGTSLHFDLEIVEIPMELPRSLPVRD